MYWIKLWFTHIYLVNCFHSRTSPNLSPIINSPLGHSAADDDNAVEDTTASPPAQSPPQPALGPPSRGEVNGQRDLGWPVRGIATYSDTEDLHAKKVLEAKTYPPSNADEPCHGSGIRSQSPNMKT
jgi:hypothetical protein